MSGGSYGGRPVAGTTALVVAAALLSGYVAVAFDRQDNREPLYAPPTTVPPDPPPTITTDEFVAQVASAVVDELDLDPADQDRIVAVLTDPDRPDVVVVPPTPRPPPTTTTTTTTTTTLVPRIIPPLSVPSIDEFQDARDQQAP